MIAKFSFRRTSTVGAKIQTRSVSAGEKCTTHRKIEWEDAGLVGVSNRQRTNIELYSKPRRSNRKTTKRGRRRRLVIRTAKCPMRLFIRTVIASHQRSDWYKLAAEAERKSHKLKLHPPFVVISIYFTQQSCTGRYCIHIPSKFLSLHSE